MKHPSDIVWDTITESAKTRFDYGAFERAFWGSTTLVEIVIFKTIAGHAADRSTDEIIADINLTLSIQGVKFPDEGLRQFVEEKRAELSREILATKVAIASFELGAEPPGVLIQVRSILNKMG